MKMSQFAILAAIIYAAPTTTKKTGLIWSGIWLLSAVVAMVIE